MRIEDGIPILGTEDLKKEYLDFSHKEGAIPAVSEVRPEMLSSEAKEVVTHTRRGIFVFPGGKIRREIRF